MRRLSLIAGIVLPALLFGQGAPAIQWKRCFGGPGYDVGYTARQTADGGYVLIGSAAAAGADVSENAGEPDIWVVRMNAAGAPLWNTTIGGSAEDVGTAIEETVDGGFLLVGFSSSNDGDLSASHGAYDAVVARLDANGSVLWVRQLGGSANEMALGLVLTPDGGGIISAASSSSNGDISDPTGGDDIWMVRVDAQGALIWERSFGGADNEWAYHVEKGMDDNYFVSGTTRSSDGDVTGFSGVADAWVLNIRGDGTLLWQRTIGGEYDDQGNHARPTSDGGCIVTGYYRIYDPVLDYAPTYALAAKLDSNGAIQWVRGHGGAEGETGSDIVPALGGGYILLGNAYGNDGVVVGHHGEVDAWLVRLDADGYFLWQRSYGGSGSDYGQYIQRTADNGLLLCGTAGSSNGDVSGFLGNYDAWLIKLEPESNVGINEDAALALPTLRVWPQPTSGLLNVALESTIRNTTLCIVDLQGRVVEQRSYAALQRTALDVQALVPGAYLLMMDRGGPRSVVRFVKE